MRRAAQLAFVIGGISLLASIAGWILAPAEFAHAWLAAVYCWMAWPLGSLALVLIHALTGGSWGYLIRRPLGAGMATLPLILPVLVPVIISGHRLYPWMQPALAAHLDNGLYLNAPFFYARTTLYLAVWLALGAAARHALRQPDHERRLSRLAPPGLILLALTVTFAAIDYTLSLEPTFESSVYGWMAGSESLLLALSAAIIGLALDARRAVDVRPLARLLLALTLFWAYLDFMQFLIVWNSDLPREAAWYLRRSTGFWGAVAAAVVIGHFALPFFVLLWARVRRSLRAVASIAALLVLAELARVWWIVIPAANRPLAWIDPAAMFAVLGVACGFALRAYPRLAHLEVAARG